MLDDVLSKFVMGMVELTSDVTAHEKGRRWSTYHMKKIFVLG